MFDENPKLSQDGGLAIATLAELKGLHEMHQDLGKLPWQQCTEPAAKLASRLFTNKNGEIKKEGDIVTNLRLADTLTQIGIQGSSYLYSTMAETLSAEVRDVGGILSADDIGSYTTRSNEPVNCEVLGHTYYGAAGSSSGGAAVAGIAEFMTFKNAFAIRLMLGDPHFVNTTGPIDALTSASYMGNLRSKTNDSSVLDLNQYGGVYNISEADRFLPDDHGTSHLSIVDNSGNAIAITSTINTYFGSKVVSPSTGIVFNNQMDDFSNSKAPNYFGLHPSKANLPEAGKRPLSSMSPFILIGSKGVRLVGGASGGPRIITATVQVLLNFLAKGFDLLSAVKAPRLHSQLLPDSVYVEMHELVSGLSIKNTEEVAADLKSRGHEVEAWNGSMGVSQYVAVDPDTGVFTAVSDPRKNGEPSAVT
eukprot:GSChrysophyteH1.ASY1.ANO1.2751.1 assembled CDS